MRTPKDSDPVRWRDLPASQSEIENEIGRAAVALAAADAAPDELRLAQLRQRLASRWLGEGRRGAWLLLRPSFRTAALVVASLAVGGVATAALGRLIARHQAKVARQAAAAAGQAHEASRRAPHRWRVAMNQPATLDLTVGSEGTELAVIKGGAQISDSDADADAGGAGPSVGKSPVVLVPGDSWRSGATGATGAGAGRKDERPSVTAAVHADSAPHGDHAGDDASRTDDRASRTVAMAQPRDRQTARPTDRATVSASARHAAGAVIAPEEERPASDEGSAPRPAPAGSPASVTAVDIAAALALSEPSPGAWEKSAASASRAPHVPPASTSAPAPPPSEAAILGRALRRLRADRDPRGALAQIDEHDRRYPAGPLSREATLARAEALLVLERKASALAVLDALALEGNVVDRPAALARAELRATSGRHADAIADFDAVLRSGGDDDTAARALFGRAMVRATAGDATGARNDLREYLRRFSDGLRRGPAEKALRRLGG